MSNLDNTANEFNNEGFTDENDPTTQKKKRRRRPNPDVEEQRNNGEDLTNDTPRRRPRRRRNEANTDAKVIPTNNLGVAAYLEDLQDDIEIRAAEDDISTIEQLHISRGKTGTFQGVGDTIYVEGSRKFKPENQEKYLNDRLKESQKVSDRLNMTENRNDNDLLQCVITITQRFRIMATFVHGLFAGLLLMFTVFSLVAATLVTNPSYFGGIISLYSLIEQPFFIFNYLMFVFIGVSIMDRCDVAQPSSTCNQNQGGIIVALVMTLISFILSNSLYYFQPYFTQYKTNVSYAAVLLSSFPTWSVIDAVKSVMVCVAWFVIALLPVYDRYVLNLRMEISQDPIVDALNDRR